jgi:perosamine synthetase
VSQTTPSRVPVAGPWITEREVAAVAHAARTAWYGDAGSGIAEFEAAFAAHTARAHAISLPSCTAGLHLSLLALGVGPGDEVIVPESTWIATSAPISYVGAQPVFVDVDPKTWCLDPARVSQAITERTRAVIVVDLYGGMPDMDALLAVCDDAGVPLVEDAAEAVGALWRGAPAGSFGATSVFSFHGSKTLTTGEGGMVVTDDDALAGRMQILRDHGRTPGDTTFRNTEVAYKYKMTAMQAAMGLVQLERLGELVDAKRALLAGYQERLRDVPGVEFNPEPPGSYSSAWMSTVLLDGSTGVTGQQLGAALAAEGIDTRPFFLPLSSLPAYEGLPGAAEAHRANPVADRLAREGLNLPSALNLREHDLDRTCDVIERVLSTKPRGLDL